VTETVIELDVSAPWQPPEPPAPRRRLRTRWVAVAAVLAVTLGVLVAGGSRSGAGLLYSLDHQVLRAQASGGRLYLARYQGTGPGPVIEARRLADGKLLWDRAVELPQQLVVAGSDVVILMSEERNSSGDASTLVVLDAATGKELWTRSRVWFNGTNPGIVVVEDARDVGDSMIIDGADYDAGINRAGTQPQRRILGLSARTGQTAWDVTVAAGSDVNFSWENPYQSRLNRFDVLSRTGQLTRRDAGTGAVTASHQLDWSGTSAMFSAGWLDGTGRPADRVVVYPDGQRGAGVYDLHTGRLLFRWPGQLNNGLFRCTDRLFCSGGDGGLDAIDSTTGERRWHLDGHDLALGFAGDRLLVGSYNRDQYTNTPRLVGIVDSRTGGMVKELTGWHLLTGGARPVVWQPLDKRTALLGELDPADGLVTVFAQAEDWFGNPDCSVDGRALACVVVGGLSVWRLPTGP
jgi:outer membrane protein assembly factor BamB